MFMLCVQTVPCISTRPSAGPAIWGCWCASKSVSHAALSCWPLTRSAASWERTRQGPGRGSPAGRVFGFNNDNWFENYGPLPTDQRHVLNLSGFVELPWRLQLAVNVAAYSAPPFAPYIAGADFNGDGTINDLLPGTTIDQFGRGLGKEDLTRLVNAYNQQIAGRPMPVGRWRRLLSSRKTIPSTMLSLLRICA